MSLSEKIKIYHREKINDSRGWFLKIMNGHEENLPDYTGEIYITVANPGETKGEHYHLLANEWFTLLKGKCRLYLLDLVDSSTEQLELDAEYPVTVFVPSNIAHAFKNISTEDDFILAAYSDQYYDGSDTISYKFNLGRSV